MSSDSAPAPAKPPSILDPMPGREHLDDLMLLDHAQQVRQLRRAVRQAQGRL